MPQTTVAAIQMTCTADPAQNLAHAEALVRQAAAAGARERFFRAPRGGPRADFCKPCKYFCFLARAAERAAAKRRTQRRGA